MPPTTVLIATADRLGALQGRGDFGAAQAFTDAEALRALEFITRQRPASVVLERSFASSSRGSALINRIKADPALAACEIRVVSAEGQPAAPVAASPAADAAPVAAPLDQRGTRRAPRVKMADGLEVSIDGNPAALVDLSVVGAMVLSPTILRPNQRVRVTIPDPGRPLRVSGAIAWAAFEMPKGGVRYRAGIEFFEPEADALARFIDVHKKT